MADNPQEFDFPIGKVVGRKGDTGNGISSIELLQTVGLNKTYRITLTDETYFDFVVTDGNGISSVSFNPETYTLTLTFDDGTSYTTGSLRGAPGQKGDDGFSPTIAVTSITGGHRVTITDKDHPQGQSFDVMDGYTDYTDLSNKPQINGHTLSGDQTAAQLGLGTYTKPSDGIPKTDLESDVQTSLGKADTALQTAPVASVAGKTGAVTLDANDVAFSKSGTYDDGTVGKELSNQKNAIDQKADKTTYVTLSGTQVTQVGADNTMYLCGTLTELTFTAPQTGITAIRFTSGSTPTVLSFSGVSIWLNGFDPTSISADTMYELNILNGVGVASWT